MKVLLLGKHGMLGSQMLKTLSGSEDFEMFAFDRKDLDITDTKALIELFSKISPDFVINCAAFTDVDACESQKGSAFKVNGEAPGAIASACKAQNAVLLHISTDYVFDGNKSDGYAEDDAPSPINVYGSSKLMGEELISKNCDDYYIIRTSWLYGENGKNFVDTMLDLATFKKELRVVDDQLGSPTYTKDFCDELLKNFLYPFIVDLPKHHDRNIPDNRVSNGRLDFGVYHLTNTGSVSWYGFAKEIFRLKNLNINLIPVKSDEFKRPARRPKCSVLKNTKFNCDIRSWDKALKAYLAIR